MSFGFSAGDFIAAAKLIGNIVSCLKHVGGAATEYQELERQLFALQRALDEIEHFRVVESQQNAANAIKVAALQCRYVLEDYAEKFKKYADTLSSRNNTGGAFHGVKRKLQFGLGMRKEAQQLRTYILVHLGALNTRLLSLGLTSISIMSEDTKTLHANQELRIDEATHAMQTLQTSQVVVQRETKSLLGQLLDLVKNDVVMRLDQITDIVTKVWNTQCQISNFLLKLGTDLPCPDTSHTWFQRPCRLEDPLGRYHAIASEYSYTQMLAVVLDKFQSGPGSRRMQSGDYEIANSRNSSHLFTKETFTGLIPGMFLRMAIILHELKANMETCPIPSCGSQISSDCVGGGKTCSKCGIWFEFESATRATSDPEGETCLRRAAKRRKVEHQFSLKSTDEDHFEVFKNVRLSRFDLVTTSYKGHVSATQDTRFEPIQKTYFTDPPFDDDNYKKQKIIPLPADRPRVDPKTISPTKWPESLRGLSPPPSSRFERPIRKRRKRTQPSQGDSVLISYLDPNRPDIAREAGERALHSDSRSEASSCE